MEIKTCEQYVLAELEQKKWEIASLAAVNGQLDAKIGELQAELYQVRDALNVLFSAKVDGADSILLGKDKDIETYALITTEPSYHVLKNFVDKDFGGRL